MLAKNNVGIVFILTQLELGGAQKICLALFDHFSPTSYLISSATGQLLGKVQNNSRFLPIKALERGVGWSSLWKEFWAFLSIYLHLLKLKRKHAFLIVHTHSSKAGILGRSAAYFAGINNIVHTVHGFGITPAQSKPIFIFFALLEQLATLLTKVIICVASPDQQLGKKLFFGFANKSVIIRAAVDTKPFLAAKTQAAAAREHNHEQNIFILGTISCFKPQKNLAALLKIMLLAEKLAATSPCPKKTIYLEIIGDGVLRQNLEQKIISYGLQRKIKLWGWQENIIPKMLKWDCFVLSSLWEGLPCSLVQALLLQQPAICYDTGGINEILQNGKNGYLVKQGDLFTFTEKIIHLCSLAKSNDSPSTNNKKLAFFDLSSMFAKHKDVYTKFFI